MKTPMKKDRFPSRWLAPACLSLAMIQFAGCGGDSSSSTPEQPGQQTPPNFVLVVVDDIGIDQWAQFGYGGYTPADTPSIDAIAAEGVRFDNLWAMPACSNGRAALFTGRYPFRTHVYTALGNNDLANYMVNPNETTLPKLLKPVGYQSALFGKYHLGIQANNPYGLGMARDATGFDYFEGWLDETGDPSSIDTTAGGVGEEGDYACGFVPDSRVDPLNGADHGACWMPDGACAGINKLATTPQAPGRVCRDQGGVFDPRQSCGASVPDYIDFNRLSAHYVSPLVINQEDGGVEAVPLTDPRARTYRGSQLIDAAVDWVDRQDQPWMVALSFATSHTPLMQPPSGTLPGRPDASGLDCASLIDQRILANLMEESLDHELGRFLVNIGVATYGADNQLIYDGDSNTYVILVSDNGSLGTTVKVPFDVTRAKSTAYQTGVWNPGLVVGPGIVEPGRAVDAMVNIVDLYQLIGELAGIEDVHATVARPLDSQPLKPYLDNPGQAPIRTGNFTEIGTNLHANGEMNSPCVFSNGGSCSQITPGATVCHDNGGVWFGENPDDASAPAQGFGKCCELATWQRYSGKTVVDSIFPKTAYGVRDAQYKLVRNIYDAYDEALYDESLYDPANPSENTACADDTVVEELYVIDQNTPSPSLDTEERNLLAAGEAGLDEIQAERYQALRGELTDLLASEASCAADVNLDGRVDQDDVAQWQRFKALTDGSSWADIDQDGVTDETDRQRIEAAFGPCAAG